MKVRNTFQKKAWEVWRMLNGSNFIYTLSSMIMLAGWDRKVQ